MIDDGARAELGDGQEARAGDELVARRARPGNEGRQRQAREVVAGQEALAREVAVAVEVRLDEVLGLGEELELGLGLIAQAAGPLLSPPAGWVASAMTLFWVCELLQRGPVETAPALAGLVEGERDLLQDLVEPAFAVPVRVRQVIAEGAEDMLGPDGGTLARLVVGHGVLHAGEQRERRGVALDIQDLPQGRAEVEPGLRQPDGLDVGPHQVFVAEIERGEWRPRRPPSAAGA